MRPYVSSGTKQITRNVGDYVKIEHTPYTMMQNPSSYRTWVVTGSSKP